MINLSSTSPEEKDSYSGLLPNFQIQQINDKAEKLQAMEKCDCAFTISVISRDDFFELFDKIHKYAVFLSVKSNDDDAGYAAIYMNDVKTFTAYITLICISPKYQRHHLGLALMTECFTKAQLAGMKQIKLEVLNQDVNAIKFYEFCGFERVGQASEQSIFMRKLF